MTTARQVIRWAVPGYSLFLIIGLFALIRFAFLHGTAALDLTAFFDWPDHAFFAEYILPQVVLVVAGAGVPVGFLIYQVYFVGYWRGLGFLRTKPQDKGWAILEGIRIDWRDAFGSGVKPPEPCDIKPRLLRSSATARQLLHNWHLAQSVLCIAVDKAASKGLRENIQYLTDVYHSVGTTRWSLMIGFGLYLCVAVSRDIPTVFGVLSLSALPGGLLATWTTTHGPWIARVIGLLRTVVRSPIPWATLLNLGLFLTMRRVLSLTRGQVLEDIISAQRYYLGAIFGMEPD